MQVTQIEQADAKVKYVAKEFGEDFVYIYHSGLSQEN